LALGWKSRRGCDDTGKKGDGLCSLGKKEQRTRKGIGVSCLERDWRGEDYVKGSIEKLKNIPSSTKRVFRVPDDYHSI